MSPFRITARRTVGFARNAYSTAVIVGAFLAAVMALFAFNLNASEGSRMSVSAVWALSVAPALPFLAAFLGMDAWSEERRSGRMDTLLATPVSELDLTLGKFAGTWILSLFATALSLVLAVVLLCVYAPSCRISVVQSSVAFAALALQGLLWSAVSVATSAMFRRSAVAAGAAIALIVAIPRGIWAALMAWSPKGRAAYGEMPFDAQLIDFAAGMISCGTAAAYLVLTALALFVAVSFVEVGRLVGRGARRARATARVSVVLAAVFSALVVFLALRLDMVVDLPIAGKPNFSERTLGILSESHGDISVTCFMRRSDVRFRPVSQLLRALSREAASRGGVRLTLRFVDPSWDFGEASRLARSGAQPGDVVFAYGRRKTSVPAGDGLGERVCASAILRLTTPPQRRSVRWTRGHGEAAFDDYGVFGMSDIARELSRDGYVNQAIDLAVDAQIPSDCALIVVAGAREEFSRAELARLDAYLRQGGRLLVLMNSDAEGGVAPLLPSWGMNIVPMAGAARTVSGSDVIVSDFSDHAVSGPIRGTSLVLESPVAFTPSAAVSTVGAVDGIVFVPLATSGENCVAAVVERGVGVGDDLDFRPTRIIAVGDSAFVLNAQLAAHANANRDFFLNAAAYLSGTDAMTSGGADGALLSVGMDRATWRRFAIFGIGVVPFGVTAFMWIVAYRRRHRG